MQSEHKIYPLLNTRAFLTRVSPHRTRLNQLTMLAGITVIHACIDYSHHQVLVLSDQILQSSYHDKNFFLGTWGGGKEAVLTDWIHKILVCISSAYWQIDFLIFKGFTTKFATGGGQKIKNFPRPTQCICLFDSKLRLMKDINSWSWGPVLITC